ncbi:hypothetical protein [Aquibacillus kalidii]|uniref:hypothetical protein n=1 Tax=Aquibacillus kalidii TaxID=2762597 RepID=UPI0016464BB0|nr:hypothetical protein [Aquibacillus kalidii]
MKKSKFLIATCFTILVACSNDTPTITKKDVPNQPTEEKTVLIESDGDEEKKDKEQAEMLLEFNLQNEQVILNLNHISILKSYLESSQNKSAEIAKMKLDKIDVSYNNTMYLLQFSCVNNECSYILLDQTEDGRSKLIADLSHLEQVISSPDGNKLLFLFSREDQTINAKVNRITVIDLKDWDTLSLVEDVPITNYEWPIQSVEWLNNNDISVSIPDLNVNDNLKEWVTTDKQTKEKVVHFE